MSNNTSAKAFVRYFTVWLHFKNTSGFFPSCMRVCLNPNGGICGGSYSKLIDSYGGIDTVVVDINTKSKLEFGSNNLVDIEPTPYSYAWKAITVIPKGLMNELAQRNYQLKKVELVAMLHPEQEKTGQSQSFSFIMLPNCSDEVDLVELSTLFPRHKFEYEFTL